MNLFFATTVNDAERKMVGYVTLLDFRYMNLCIKSEPASLMPVNVLFGTEEQNIEEVSQIGVPDDFHLAVIPKFDDAIPYIVKGIASAHPEFKLEMKTMEINGEEKKYLLYEMPEVDQNRRDLLNGAVKSLHDEAKIRIDGIKADTKMSFGELLKDSPQDLDEVNKAVDDAYDNYIGKIDDLLFDKEQEIEEGYKRYLETHHEVESSPVNDHDVVFGMRMNQNDE